MVSVYTFWSDVEILVTAHLWLYFPEEYSFIITVNAEAGSCWASLNTTSTIVEFKIRNDVIDMLFVWSCKFWFGVLFDGLLGFVFCTVFFFDAFALTVTLHFNLVLATFAVITAVPFFFAFTLPFFETLATLFLPEDHFTFFFVFFTFSVLLSPTLIVSFFLLSTGFFAFAYPWFGIINEIAASSATDVHKILFFCILHSSYYFLLEFSIQA